MTTEISKPRNLEADEKLKLRQWFSERKIFNFWPVQQGYGQAALDCYACHNGLFIGIEVKRFGYTASDFTARQIEIIKEIWDKGGLCAHGTADEIIEQISLHRWPPVPEVKRRK